MGAQHHGLVGHPVSLFTDAVDDGSPRVSVSRPREVSHIFQNQIFRTLGPNNFHDVEKQSASGLVSNAFLSARLGERLAWKPRTKDVMIGNKFFDLLGGLRLSVVVLRDAPNVGRELFFGKTGEGSPIHLPALFIHFARHDTFTAQRFKGMVEAPDAGKEVDEFE